jgi:uncharacterized membrane protein (Fun14 family)
VNNPSDVAFYWRWVWANGWAELLGLGCTLLLGWFGTRVFAAEQASTIFILGGALAAIGFGTLLEGVLIGFAQARVLRERLPPLPLKSWIMATALGAAIAWALGMIPSTIMGLMSPQHASSPPDLPDSAQYLLATAMGLVLGAILGIPQWHVLRRYVPRAGFWVAANALAWLIGMPLIFFGMGTLTENADIVRVILTVFATCLATGVVVGAIHGWALVRLLRRDDAAAAAVA